MKFPYPQVEGLEDAQGNFEFLEGSNLYWGSGAPTLIPPGNKTSFYFRDDTPTIANQRIYVYTGSAWTGIL